MNNNNRHFHSIIVHPIVALSLVAAFSYFCMNNGIELLRMGRMEWQLLCFISLSLIFLLSVPATLSGVFETNKMYAKWHNTHKIKLFLSVLLFLLSLTEIFLFFNYDAVFLTGLLIYVANIVVIFFLSFYGLKITLGRQSLARTSYIPDFFNKDNPVDILKEAGEYIKEKPKRVDFFDFGDE